MYVWRWIIFAVVALGFFFVALSGDIYNITSPPTLTWHVLLRKAYSIVAFALVGGTFVWASRAPIGTSILGVALYSGAIEVAQHELYNNEPFFWNLLDVLCGAIGGAIGPLIPPFRAR